MHRTLDRLCFEYAAALEKAGLAADVRAGKIVGTAALFSIRARQPLGLLGPAPLDGELDEPDVGVVGGFGEFHQVDPERPWTGGRWVVRTEAGQRFPLTLSMLMFDSSGANKEGARSEHQDALRTVVKASAMPEADPLAVTCALDWLLYDWLMAHRDGPDSAEIVFPKGHDDAAAVVVSAAAASVAARSTFDPGLLLAVRGGAAGGSPPDPVAAAGLRSGGCPARLTDPCQVGAVSVGPRVTLALCHVGVGARESTALREQWEDDVVQFFRVAGGPVDRRAPDVAVR